jgi:glucose-6-phosphate isomerase
MDKDKENRMSVETSQKFLWGKSEPLIQEWLKNAKKNRLVERIWDKDASVWTQELGAHKEIVSRLGWLEAPSRMREALDEIGAFADEIKKEGFESVVLLGMGGSSLAPELFQKTFGNAPGCPALLVLDSTDPAQVLEIEKSVNLEKTLFIVSSKSGGTIELLSFFKYFFAKLEAIQKEKAGSHFVAITDPGTPLVDLAKEKKFRKIFLGFEDVGGRFSALTFFGLVPAALIGVDIEALLDRAEDLPQKDPQALELGVAMAVLAEEGRDKLTLWTSRGLESFGDWAEQLVAESTGKEGMGVIPIVGEGPISGDVYGNDRFFVALFLDGVDNQELEQKLDVLSKAGHPVLILRIRDLLDLGAEFFRWEMATAIACALLKINAFDQPDVQAAKDKAKALLKKMGQGQKLEVKNAVLDLKQFCAELNEGDYVGILAFLPYKEQALTKLKTLAAKIREASGKAVTLGMGPRYLHSTGQLHKGGPAGGNFILVTGSHSQDAAVPGESYSFGELELAQAVGDLEALEAAGRRVVCVKFEDLKP